MDPRTFLPPPRLETAAPPRVGDPAPTLALPEQELRSGVVAFLRHVGCPFSEATAQALSAAAVAHPDVNWIAISHAPQGPTDRWCSTVGLEGVHVHVDEDRSVYAAWGLGRSNLRHFLGLRSLRSAAALARRGIRNRHPVGTRWQQAGTFALDSDGIVRWRHLPEHAGELPDLEAAARAARGELELAPE